MNAFPNPHLTHQTGMTLRDYFAAKAMQAILSIPEYVGDDAALAAQSYNVADAMMEARNAAQ
jgi:hypothetical protein